MKTQKQALEIYKTVRVNVLSFENGVRYSSYGNLDLITAFVEVARKTTLGFKVLILDPSKDESIKWEIKNKSRISFSIARNWVITNSNLFDL